MVPEAKTDKTCRNSDRQLCVRTGFCQCALVKSGMEPEPYFGCLQLPQISTYYGYATRVKQLDTSYTRCERNTRAAYGWQMQQQQSRCNARSFKQHYTRTSLAGGPEPPATNDCAPCTSKDRPASSDIRGAHATLKPAHPPGQPPVRIPVSSASMVVSSAPITLRASLLLRIARGPFPVT